ncbi:uncharacterized protein [Musca autumnalis]|uniref:uncharacterized protein n=1 Tax=Musca autumnalis TaxID=221902 RepID=UPI003CE7B31B
MKFNPTKTNAIHFNRKSRPLEISCNGTPIPEVSKIKYLGFYIASNNSATDHIDYTLDKVDKTSQFLNILGGCRFGIDPRKSLLLYKTCVRSKVEYGAAALANADKRSLTRIKIATNSFLRKSLGLIKATPTQYVYHLAAELPPEARFQLSAAKEIIKSYAYDRPIVRTLEELPRSINTGLSKTLNRFKHIISDVGKSSPFSLKPINVTVFDDFFNGITAGKKHANPEIINSIYKEKISRLEADNFEIFFSDGSVLPDHTGSAFVHKATGTVFSFFNNKVLSSMSAELIAMGKALEFAINNEMNNVAILTDSLSGALAIKNGGKCNSLVQSFANLASQINGRIEIHFIPGHSNILFNEAADQAAKKAKEIGSELDTPLTINDAIAMVYDELWKEWNNIYINRSQNSNSHFLRIFPRAKKRPWFGKLDIKPIRCKQLNRILADNGFTNSTLAKIGVKPSALCEICNTEETADHVLFKCSRYNYIRNSFHSFNNINSLEEFLNKYGFEKISIIAEFLDKSNVEL